MIVYSDELYHYGVKGMRWGHRKKYGMSKGSLKRKIRKAKRSYRKASDDHYMFNGVTGKNWAKVRKEHLSEIEKDSSIREYDKKRDREYSIASKYDRNGKYALAEKHQNLGDNYQDKRVKRETQIGKKYASKYDEALLKDISYSNIELGKQMLNEYNVHNKWGTAGLNVPYGGK